MTPEKNKEFLEKLIILLQKHELFSMVNLYTNGIHYRSDPPYHSEDDSGWITHRTPFGTYYETGPCDVTTIVEYNNPDTITVTFEGPLYMEYNGYTRHTDITEKIRKLADRYDLYPEQGYAWSLAFYE